MTLVEKRDQFKSLATPLALIILGIGSAYLYYWARDLHRFTQGIAGYISLFIGQFAIYLLASYAVWRKPQTAPRWATWPTLVLVLLFAIAFRAPLVSQRPYLSTDVYRYLWDGRVQAAGINPYRYVPGAEELKPLRDEKIFPQINRSDYAPTPYPPVAQAIYYLAYLINPLSVTAFKSLMSIFDLLGVLAVMLALRRTGLDPARAIVYAWHPLLILEGAHTGHIESPFIAFLAFALLAWADKRPVLTGISIGLAAMVKFYPALVLPVFFFSAIESAEVKDVKRSVSYWLTRIWRALFERANLLLMGAFVATVVVAYLPYLNIGLGVFASLSNEFREEGFVETGERYFFLSFARLLAPVPTGLFLGGAAIALIGLGLKLMLQAKRDVREVASAGVALIGLYLFVTTPRYSWYYAWILPFLCFAPQIGWLYLTGASVLLYGLWCIPNVYPEMPIWLGLSLYLPTILFLFWNRWRAATGSRWLKVER